jgi:hypothetical protein
MHQDRISGRQSQPCGDRVGDRGGARPGVDDEDEWALAVDMDPGPDPVEQIGQQPNLGDVRPRCQKYRVLGRCGQAGETAQRRTQSGEQESAVRAWRAISGQSGLPGGFQAMLGRVSTRWRIAGRQRRGWAAA